MTEKGRVNMLKEAIIFFYTYYNIDISGPLWVGEASRRQYLRAISACFWQNRPNIDINISTHPRNWPNIDINILTHPRYCRDIAITVSQDALAKRAVGSILGAFGALNSVNFAEFSLQREIPIIEASPHPALCCPCCTQNSVNFAEF